MGEQTIPASGRSYEGMTRPAQDGSSFTASPSGPPNEQTPRWRRGPLSGARVGDYQMGALLGVGGMAEVYRAKDLVLQRDVAIKVLATQLADDADSVKRFRAEARRVGSISHPRLVPVYYAGEAEVRGKHLLYLVMPLMRESLRDLRQRAGKLPASEAAWLVLQVAEGLEAAHRSGIIHRDVKPGNVLLDAEGHPSLTDFGIARELCATSSDMTETENGLVVGTPGYMAPEQLCGDPLDQRADVYALGAVFYELLTGQRPFVGATPYDLAAHVLHTPLTPPSVLEPAIPPAVERVALTALARNPAQRYASAAEFAQALRQAFISRREAPQQLDLSGLLLTPPPRHGNSLPSAARLQYADPDATWQTGGWRIGEWRTGRRRHLWPQALLIAMLLFVFTGSAGVLAMLQSGGGLMIGAPASSHGAFESVSAIPIGRTIRLGEPAPSVIAPGSQTGAAPASFASPGAKPHSKHVEKHGDTSGAKSHGKSGGKSGHHDSGDN